MTPVEIIRAHTANLTEEDEEAIGEHIDLDGYGYVIDDYANLAIRTCSCGKNIDGFYEYQDHLIAALESKL